MGVDIHRRGMILLAFLLAISAVLGLSMVSVGSPPSGDQIDLTPTAFVYCPLILGPHIVCPLTSTHLYTQGVAYQFDGDDPVRPTYLHADKNIALRGYTPNSDTAFKRELVDYGSDDPKQPPQFATLFDPPRVPALTGFYRVHHWEWAPSPSPGTRKGPLTDYPVTALGLQTVYSETVYVPASGYDIGGGMEVLVLFADEDTVALRYTRHDSSAPGGYTLHIDNICTDPNLLALYTSLDDPSGPRYQYPNLSYHLPNLPAGYPVGTARGAEVVVAIADTGQFQPPLSCNEWWQVRPGYPGECPVP